MPDSRTTFRLPDFSRPQTALLWAALAVALRLAYMGWIELLPEEAYYWQYAQHLAPGYIDHPPLVGATIWVFTRLLGISEFALRAGAVFWWMLSAWAVWKLACELRGKCAAACAVMLFALLPYFFGAGLMITPDSPLLAFWAWALWFLYRIFFHNSRGAWYGLALCLGLGMLSKYTIALLGPSLLLFMLLDREAGRSLFRIDPYLCALLALLLFSPVILWNMDNQWASFAFQGSQRIHQAPRFYLPEFLLHLLAVLTPAGLAVFLRLPGLSVNRRELTFLGCLILPAVLLFAGFSLQHQVKLNWSGPVFLALLPVLGASVLWQRHEQSGWRRIVGLVWGASVPLLFAIYWASLHFLAFGLPYVPYTQKMTRFLAWEDLAAQVIEIEGQLAQTSGAPVTVVGMDKHYLASELDFYRRKLSPQARTVRATAGRSLFGQPALMYRFWSRPENYSGHTLIMLSRTPSDLREELLAPCLQSLDAPRQIVTRRNGYITGRFHYRIGYAYRKCAG